MGYITSKNLFKVPPNTLQKPFNSTPKCPLNPEKYSTNTKCPWVFLGVPRFFGPETVSSLIRKADEQLHEHQ